MCVGARGIRIHTLHMSMKRVEMDRKAFALFPLRRSHVPRHMRFDQNVLTDILGSELRKHAAATKAAPNSKRAPKRKRDDPTLVAEKAAVFNQVLL